MNVKLWVSKKAELQQKKAMLATNIHEEYERLLEAGLKRAGAAITLRAASQQEIIRAVKAEVFDIIVLARSVMDGSKVVAGIKDPVKVIQEIKKYSPGTEIFFLAGEQDGEFKTIFEACEKVGVEYVMASEQESYLDESTLEQVFDEIKRRWSRGTGKVFSIEGVRTGVGVTTVAAAIAAMMAEGKEKSRVSVVGTPGIAMHLIEAEEIPVEVISEGNSENIIYAQSRERDFVIAEFPYSKADFRLLVMDQTPESLLNAKEWVDSLNGSAHSTKFLLNAFHDDGPPVEAIAQMVGWENFFIIKDDRGSALRAAGTGQPALGPAWTDELRNLVRQFMQ